MTDHAHQGERDSAAAEVREPDSGRTSEHLRRLPIRREFNERFAACVEGVLAGLWASGDHRASNHAIARAWGCDESYVRAVRKAEKWQPGDVLALHAHPETRHAASIIWSTLGSLMSTDSPCIAMPPSKRLALFIRELGPVGDACFAAESDDDVSPEEEAAIAIKYLEARRVGDEFVRATLAPPASGPRAVKKTQMQIDTSAIAGAVAGVRR